MSSSPSSSPKKKKPCTATRQAVASADNNSKINIHVFEGLTKEERDRIDPQPVKWTLQDIVDKLLEQVKEDWHDGYEEQLETKIEWFYALEGPLQAVLDIGVHKSEALYECNEILKIIADSYDALLVCNCRCDGDLADAGETFELLLPWRCNTNKNNEDCVAMDDEEESDDDNRDISKNNEPQSEKLATFECRSGNLHEMWKYVWIALLRVHSTKNRIGTDTSNSDNGELLFRCIKDMMDNQSSSEDDNKKYRRAIFLYKKSPLCLFDRKKYMDEEEAEYTDMDDAPSRLDLDKLIHDEENEWKNLPTTKKNHKLKPIIDRRSDTVEEPPFSWANNEMARALLLYAMHRNNSTMTEAELDAMLHRADTTDTHGMTPEEIHAALAPP